MRIERQVPTRRTEVLGETKGDDFGRDADISVKSMYVGGTWRVAEV